jgi:hypothetical protein
VHGEEHTSRRVYPVCSPPKLKIASRKLKEYGIQSLVATAPTMKRVEDAIGSFSVQYGVTSEFYVVKKEKGAVSLKFA